MAEFLAPSKLFINSGCYCCCHWCYHCCYWWCLCGILLIPSNSSYILENDLFSMEQEQPTSDHHHLLLGWPFALKSDNCLFKIAHSCLLHSWICNSSDFSSSVASLQGLKPINRILVAKLLPNSPASSFYFMLHKHH